MNVVPILENILRTKPDWTQTDLAKELKVTQPTVSRWLDGAEPKINQRDQIVKLAEKLGVLDSRRRRDLNVEVVGYVGAGGQVLYGEGQGPFGEAPMPPKGGTPSTVAVVVRGDSMAGQLEDGWTVYYDRRHGKPTESLYGKLCVVGLADGRVLIKKLLPGRKEGHYDLYSVNASPLLDQEIEWAARVSWINPT